MTVLSAKAMFNFNFNCSNACFLGKQQQQPPPQNCADEIEPPAAAAEAEGCLDQNVSVCLSVY